LKANIIGELGFQEDVGNESRKGGSILLD